MTETDLAAEATDRAARAGRRSDRRVPRRAARRDLARWSRTIAGRWSCSAPAGARAPSTSWPPDCCVTRGAGPTVIVSPLLGAHAQPDRVGRAGWDPQRHHQQRQPRRVGRDRRASSTATRSTCCSCRRNGSRTRAFRDRRAAEGRGAGRPARGRRGALHQRLGPRLPARLPPHRPPARPPARRRARARHHRHRQRPRRRRHRGPVRRRARSPSAVRSPAEPRARRASSCRTQPERLGVARHGHARRCPAPGSSTA